MRTVSGTQTSAGGDGAEEDPLGFEFPRDFEGGDTVDRFVILRPIGEGGMGVVYLAQDPELDRKVALKFLRPARKRSLQRLRGRLLREAQAMAQLNHPNVITVHAVGEFEGRIYLAMEFVEGITLEKWLKKQRRDWRDILSIFMQAGRGLVAAHEQGLVHRDFKPDNVQIGNDGSVRVMDFGLVRAVGASNDPGTPGSFEPPGSEEAGLSLTRVGDAVGTPAYMSPEQHLKVPADAAADQFGFCVSLYEAFYRRRPFRGENRAEVAQSVIDGQVREAPKGSDIPAAVHRIILRGLARDPADRWGSVQELLDALERATTRRLPWAWVTGGAVAVICGVAVLMSIGDSPCERATTTMDGLWSDVRKNGIEGAIRDTRMPYVEDTWARVETQLDAYAETWRVVARQNCDATHVRGDQDEATMDLRTACLANRADAFAALLDVFEGADADVAQNAAAAVTSLPPVDTCSNLDVLQAEVAPPMDDSATQTVADIRQRLSVAVALNLAGKYAEAEELAATLVVDAEATKYEPVIAEARYWHGTALSSVGRDDEGRAALEKAYFSAAELGMTEVARDSASSLIYVVGFRLSRYDEALQWAKHARVHLARARDAKAEAELLGRIGLVLRGLGKFTEAVQSHRDALELLTSAEETYPLEVAHEHANLSNALRETARYEDAREHMQMAIALREGSLGSQHPVTAGGYAELAMVLRHLGQYEASLEQAQRALRVYESTLGGPHPWLASAHDTTASTLMAMGNLEEALKEYGIAVDIYDAFGSKRSPKLATTLSNMGVVLRRLGRLDESVATHRRALRIREAALGPDHPKVAVSLNNLGACLYSQGKQDEAAQNFERALTIRRKTLGPKHPTLANSLINLAQILVGQQRYAEALPKLKEAVDIRESALGPEHPDLAVALIGLAEGLVRAGRAQEALTYAERAVRVREDAAGDTTVLAMARFALAEALEATGSDHDRAIVLAEQALEELKDDPGLSAEAERIELWLEASR